MKIAPFVVRNHASIDYLGQTILLVAINLTKAEPQIHAH